MADCFMSEVAIPAISVMQTNSLPIFIYLQFKAADILRIKCNNMFIYVNEMNILILSSLNALYI